MNKNKCEVKKIIYKHAEVERPKGVSVQQIPPLIEKDSKSATEIKVAEQELPESQPLVDVSVPVLNSTLCVKKRLKQIEETKRRNFKDIEDVPQPEKNTIDEKITKQLNFPFDKKLYKELISLKLSDKRVLQPTTVSHEPVIRDKVPKLENFFTPQTNFEYSIPVSSNLGTHTTSKHYDGLRLHKVMRTWKDKRPN